MNFDKFTTEQRICCAQAIEAALNRRRHHHIIMGENVVVQGSLAKALKLPELIKKLRSPQAIKRDLAAEQLESIWQSLSQATQEHVKQELNWYDPKDLTWDDPRSNRNPTLTKQK